MQSKTFLHALPLNAAIWLGWSIRCITLYLLSDASVENDNSLGEQLALSHYLRQRIAALCVEHNCHDCEGVLARSTSQLLQN